MFLYAGGRLESVPPFLKKNNFFLERLKRLAAVCLIYL